MDQKSLKSRFGGAWGLRGDPGDPWNAKRSEKGLRDPPPPPLRRVTFWSLFAKYYQKCVFMLIFPYLFPVPRFGVKMDTLKEGWI